MTTIKLRGFDDEPRSIDCTPTWSGVMPLLLEGVKQDIPEARKELFRLARLVDKLIEQDKEAQS